MSASGEMPRPVGMRSADMPPATAATHAANRAPTTPPDAKGQTDGTGGGGVSFCVPGVWWRHPADRVHHRARAESPNHRRQEPAHFEAEIRKLAKARMASPAYGSAAARVSCPRATRRLGRARAGPRRMRRDSDVARRTARDRHPQPLTGSHATVRTAREKGGFKTGLR